MTEILLSILGSTTIQLVISQVLNRRGVKIDNDSKLDDVWIKRVDALEKAIEEKEERLIKIEKKVCYRENCSQRI